MNIFLDFDGTITAKDTVGELARFALGVQAAEGADLATAWDAVVRAYVEDHGAHARGYDPPAAARTAPEQEIAFLRRAKAVEARSLARVRDCALFRGIEREAFRAAGRELVRAGAVRLRPGFRAFAARWAAAPGARVWVLSVNWSAAFIEGVCGDVPGLTVVANDVRPADGSVAGPPALDLPGDPPGQPRILTNSRDKLDAMHALLRAAAREAHPSVYFGDSTTDLECLLAAHRGFVVADHDGSSLLQTLRRIGKEVPHVRNRDAASSNSLAWTSDFDSVLDLELV
ncbi:haloacid dehalogenase-like hydrolase-domain-containing protein [Durotheca rogersii]|uniref:haloacid dehalogenase-like hydrolase-domain-containing protein n=1 Tax=Durotheca rogersii TaxID=419775 RepID=UPI0022204AFD|nr:haloacid dehalogenase-like hydrolase-domain-containing protein [Durotheca rogersii]KAI5868687.1 haloacid dehalogenase-like hydrolase-domain-containing protein [Durotheca rogersii]